LYMIAIVMQLFVQNYVCARSSMGLRHQELAHSQVRDDRGLFASGHIPRLLPQVAPQCHHHWSKCGSLLHSDSRSWSTHRPMMISGWWIILMTHTWWGWIKSLSYSDHIELFLYYVTNSIHVSCSDHWVGKHYRKISKIHWPKTNKNIV
jgi:hypothetical protein